MEDFLAQLVSVDGGKVIAVLGLLMWMDLRKSVTGMAKSLELLTVQMGIIVARVDSHEKRIDHLEGH